MNNVLRRKRRWRWAALAAGFLPLICLVHGEDAPREPRVDTIRSDAILELNAPLLRTNTLLFARYWVAADHYSLAVVWAEPSVTGLNFPAKPMTLTIDSGPRDFSLASQRQPGLTMTFAKPVGQRGIFQHKFNSYPPADLRFADSEALAARVYLRDLQNVPQDTNDTFCTVDMRRAGAGEEEDQIVKLELRRDEGYVTDVNLMDAHNCLTKKIHYDYRTDNDKKLLQQETVLLPETFVTVGFLGKGATITLNGHQRTFKELPAFRHVGGRECTIDYDSFAMEDRLLATPSKIAVRKADDKTTLRIAHMSNFVHLKLSAKEAEQAARQFARLDAEEQAVQQLLERYWLKDANEVTPEDAATMNRLRARFEDCSPRGQIAGEQLKRLSLLMQLDWMQNDRALQRHFREYLATLTANGCTETLLSAGCEMIDITARWRRFADGDLMAERWLDTVMASCHPDSIRRYVEPQDPRTRLWIVARLLEKSLQAQDWGAARLAGQVLRCKVLQKLNEALQTPDAAKVGPIKAQVAWAASSYGAENVAKALQQSVAEAVRDSSALKEPTKEQDALKRQLDAIEKALGKADTPPSSGE